MSDRGRRRRGGLLAVPAGVLLLLAGLLALSALAGPLRQEGGSGTERSAREVAETTPDSDGELEFPDFIRPDEDPEGKLTGGPARAPVLRPIAALAEPRDGARVAGRLSTRTPEGTDEVVLALERRQDESGQIWVRVRLPVLPVNTTGWVPREALGTFETMDRRLVVDLRATTITLYEDDRRLFRARIGIGKEQWPTPRGRFYVRNRLAGFDDPFYGPVAFGTSARSEVLTDWPAGGFVGIHGTNRPEILPGRVSHGCIRLENDDILRLAELLPVGTPLTIR